MSCLGQNLPHETAAAHATGTSRFIDDIPPRAGELFVEVFGSPVPHGRVEGLRLDEARRTAGVVAVLTASDIPGHNELGPIVRDEHLLASDLVTYIGDPLVLIAAESRAAALQARRLVQAEITPLPPVLTIPEAIAAQSFLGSTRVMETGEWLTAFSRADRHLEGELMIGGQEHFYLESQAAIAYPEEQGRIVILSSTQHPSEVQGVVAELLGLPLNHVTVECRRLGGGFGGKETQAAHPAAQAALVAWHTRRPARIVLGRDDDMAHTGKRHPFWARYRVGFSHAGELQALELELFSNGGCSTDLSPSVLERAMLHVDNAYYLPAARIVGRVCRTNLPSNTAFRGFGGPQGVACIEGILEDMAHVLGRDAYDLRQRNAYGASPRNVTHYGQLVGNQVLPELLAQLRQSSDYDARRTEVQTFNQTSRTEVRGLAMTAVKFGISFTNRILNQANALVNVYTDGSVLVTTGATEMGQGVHTRIRQLVADDLGISFDRVAIGVTSTDKNHNTSPTAASCGTDLNGAAALDATARIRGRLAEFAATLLADTLRGLPPSPAHIQFAENCVRDSRTPERRLPFAELVLRAYQQRISLGERGFYATPGVDFDRETGKGTPFLYYTNGAAVAEVVIDRHTGELRVDRLDVLMDLGESINPGIDRGQVTGGLIQGMGWVTTEELKYDANGKLLSHSPTTYKIPNISDVPVDFRVTFFTNPNSMVSLKRSKAAGEPPLLLGLSVWAAAKNALGHLGGDGPVALSIPVTCEALALALRERSGRHRKEAIAHALP